MRGALGQCRAWTRHGRHFGGFSWWHPSARTGRVQPAARGRCDRNSRHPDCLQGRRHSTLRCGLCGRGHLPYPGGAPGCCKNTQSPQITPSLPLGQAPHAVRRPPCRAAASRFHIPVFHATFVPHAIPRPPHTWAASPYGIAVSPYNHTPDAFPHTFSADPPYNPQAPKNPTPNLERPATGHANPQPTLPNRCPEPTLQSSKPSAGQFQQMLQTCDWGVPSPPARTVTHAHGQGHACTAMFIPLRVMYTAMASGRISDETSVRRRRSPTNPAKQTSRTCVTSPRIYASNLSTQKPWGAWAWRRFATRRRRGPALRPARRPAAQARGSPGSRGRLDPAKVRRRSVRAIGSAGRTTDHAGQARRHAGARVRSLHFPTLSRIS